MISALVPASAPRFQPERHVVLLLALGRIAVRVEAMRAQVEASRRERAADPCLRAGWNDYTMTVSPPCFLRDVTVSTWTSEGFEVVCDKRWKVWPESMCAACKRNGARAKHEAGLRRRIAGMRGAMSRLAKVARHAKTREAACPECGALVRQLASGRLTQHQRARRADERRRRTSVRCEGSGVTVGGGGAWANLCATVGW